MEIFAKNLNQLLSENKISRYKFAKDIGVNKQTVSFWCEEVNEPKISYLKKIAEYFDVSADFLLGLKTYDGQDTPKTSSADNNVTGNGNVVIINSDKVRIRT